MEYNPVGNIHSVETFGAVDGPGVRYVLFLQGCPLRCLYCHNPDSRRFCKGKEMTAQETMEEILKYRNFIRSGGVTISGGEPLMQPEFCEAVVDACHEHSLHVALDTSGAVPPEKVRSLLEKADLLLLDIKALDPELCERLTGFGNQSAIDTLKFRQQRHLPVWVRHVMVPGYTLDFEELERLAAFLSGFDCIQRVELLPFHKMGEFKWQELGEDYQLYDTPQPTQQEIQRAHAIFERHGLKLS